MGSFALLYTLCRRVLAHAPAGSELARSGEVLAACALVALFGAVLVVGHAQREERALVKALRTARTGNAVTRRAFLRPRRRLWVVGVISTTLGEAAVALADGDAGTAEAALSADSFFARGGPMANLRRVIRADLARVLGTEDSLAESIRALLAIGPVPHAEAERYRLHVLVTSVLEHGDLEAARSVAEDLLARAGDPELAIYLVWLRAWFELTHLPTPDAPVVRLALLAAKNHGAIDLVHRLERDVGPLEVDVAPDPRPE
jgi:hypothetical protein